MVALPDEVMALMNDKQATKVLGTRSAKGDVHVINVGGAGALDPQTIFVGEIFMKKSGENLKSSQKDGALVSILVSKGFQAYEILLKVKEHHLYHLLTFF